MERTRKNQKSTKVVETEPSMRNSFYDNFLKKIEKENASIVKNENKQTPIVKCKKKRYSTSNKSNNAIDKFGGIEDENQSKDNSFFSKKIEVIPKVRKMTQIFKKNDFIISPKKSPKKENKNVHKLKLQENKSPSNNDNNIKSDKINKNKRNSENKDILIETDNNVINSNQNIDKLKSKNIENILPQLNSKPPLIPKNEIKKNILKKEIIEKRKKGICCLPFL